MVRAPVCGPGAKRSRIWRIAPITFAHRGARLEAPDNSLPAFTLALAAGASGLESDVRLAEDGTPVLAHGETVRRGLRRLRVDRARPDALAELAVPTLAALYETCGSGFELSLDLKTANAAEPVIDAARSAGAVERLWLCSPSMDVLTGIRSRHADVKLVHSVRKRELPAPVERHAADLQRAGIQVMNMHHTDWSAGLVSMFHRFEVLAFAWDAQEVRSLREMLRIGVDAIYCDRPERMVAVVSEFAENR